jgi:threonine aldolase
MELVDLRSDTVTRPTPAMRKAMAEAEVGDDVFGEDPTVKRLQERVAALLGKEAALFVPSGTMANQIALKAHLRPGDEVIIGQNAHCWRHESGALAALAGAQTFQLPTPTFTAADVKAAYKSDADAHTSPTRVVAVENTHNMGGGIVWDPAALSEVTAAAHALGLATHLDGARLWNAAVASQRSEGELAAGFDTVSVCLSKGLGAPVGSLVAGTRDVIRRCHRLRKMHGGGMRQAGILAAAGLYALDHHRERLAEDHAHARMLAEALAASPNVAIDPANVRTNIVMIDFRTDIAEALVAKAKQEGVLVSLYGPRRIRCVVHLDVTRAGVERAVRALGTLSTSST